MTPLPHASSGARRPLQPGRACAVRGCDERISKGMAMCKPHWSQVPGDLQRALYRAYRDRGRPGGVADHLQALEDARAFVECREPRELFDRDERDGL